MTNLAKWIKTSEFLCMCVFVCVWEKRFYHGIEKIAYSNIIHRTGEKNQSDSNLHISHVYVCVCANAQNDPLNKVTNSGITINMKFQIISYDNDEDDVMINPMKSNGTAKLMGNENPGIEYEWMRWKKKGTNKL